MRKKALIPLLCLTLLAVACDDSAYRKAAKSAATISTSLKAAQQVNAQLYAQGQLTRDETVAVAQAIGNASAANELFVQRLRLLENGKPANIAAIVHELALSIDGLSQAVLHIQDPAARQKIQLTVATIDAAIQLIQAVR